MSKKHKNHPLGGEASKWGSIMFVGFFVFTFIATPFTAFSAATIQASLQPSFEANLTTSLALQTGRGNPVFSRASTAYMQDWEGLFKQVKSGEARFTGARRVENLLSYTEDFSTTWVPVSLTVTPNQTASPIGTNTADLFTTSGVGGQRVTQGSITVNSTSVTYSVWIKSGTATNAKLLIYDSTVGATRASQQVTLTSSWKRFSLSTSNLVSGNTHIFYIYIDESASNGVGATAYVWGAQAEITAGQSNQNPSEYVSKNVLSSPYHGANVDGVKYFDRQNGNTVSSNVVTENNGEKISENTLRGYLAEGVRTNLALYSEQFDNVAWTGDGTRLTPVANSAVAPNGMTTADTIGSTAISTASNYQDITGLGTLANRTFTFSIYLKNVSGNSSPQLTIRIIGISGVDSQTAVTTGTPADTWTRYTVTKTFSAGETATGLRITITTSGQTFQSYAWGAQVEEGSFESSYIPTTSASVARSGDLLAYPTSGNIGERAFSLYLEMNRKNNSGTSAPSKSPIQIGSYATNSSVNFGGYSGTNLTILTNFGTVWDVATNPFSITYNTSTKIALRLANDLATFSSYKNGVKGTNSVSGTAKTLNWAGSPSYIYIANAGTADTDQNINVKNVKIWSRALTDSQLINMTKNTESFSLQSIAPKTTLKTQSKTGLVGHWNFDDNAGIKAGDVSGGGNIGTLTNSPTWTIGKIGKALNFNGSSSYVVGNGSALSNVGTAGNVTISAWVKPNTVSGQQTVFSKGASGSCFNYGMTIYSGGILRGRNSTNDYALGGTIVANRWQHLTIVFSPSGMQGFINGVSVGSVANTTTTCTNNNWVIGTRAYNAAASEFFSGLIDDVRVYNRALTEAEVIALYRSGGATLNIGQNDKIANGLVGLWSFDGKDMNWATGRATDGSGNGNNGVFVNMSTTTSPVPGKIGSALKFDGSDDYISVNNTSSLQPLTGNWAVSFWIYRLGTGLSDYPQVVGSRPWTTSTDKGWAVSYSTASSKIGAHYADGSIGFDVTATQSTSVVPLRTWQHWVVVFDRTNGKLNYYLNGQLDVQQSPTFPSGTINQTDNLYMGREIGGANARRLNANIDDVRLYNRALSVTEIKQLYNLGR